MAKFIEVHAEGDRFLVNLNAVSFIHEDERGRAELVFNADAGETYNVDETYDEIRLKIGSAQGGIPMDQSKAY